MRQRTTWLIGTIALVAGLVSCSRGTNPVAPVGAAPQETGDGFLTIRTEKVEYRRLTDPYGGVFTATVANTSDRLFYARLGDALYAAVDQPVLFATAGSHGFLEQWDPPSWRSIERPFMDEGVSVVELRPHSTYSLRGYFRSPSTGFGRWPTPVSLRFRVQYFDDAATSPDKAHQDFSNTFVLE
jgi:hypothetical protein